jgi:hypothetical protein
MRKLIVAMALLLAAGAAQAQIADADKGFYLGAGVSQTKIDDFGQEFGVGDVDDFEIDDTTWKVIAGFRLLNWLAIEANYVDLGSQDTEVAGVGFDADASAITAYGIGIVPVGPIDLFGKIGVARWEVDGSFRGVTINDLEEDNGTEFAYGAGVQLRLGSLAGRLEYETYDIENTDGLEQITLAVTWTFL